MNRDRDKAKRFRPKASRLLVGLAALMGLLALVAQDFRITEISVGPEGKPHLRFQSDTNFYYILYRGDQVTNIALATDLKIGTADRGALTDSENSENTAFYRIRKVPIDQPVDTDRDGVNDLQELLAGHNPLDSTDGKSNPLTTITSSPANGENEVSVTRETILYFSSPLADNTIITTNHLYATFGGRRLLARPELSSDGHKVSLFYLEPSGNRVNLPGNARVRVTFNANGVIDYQGRLVDADGDGVPGGIAHIDFETLSQTPLRGTTVCGRVFASELSIRTNGGASSSVNVPLKGVIITADGLEDVVRATTDQMGNFKLTNAPAGEFFVHIDGHAVTNLAAGIRFPDLAYYPAVGKLWASVPGAETNIGEVYLPLIADNTLHSVSTTQPTTVTFPSNVLANHPELTGVSITIPPNALFSDNGSRGGLVGIAPVPPDRLPGPLPDDLKFPLVITVQTDGAQNFDQPAPACFPNLPDPVTGITLAPGSKTALWSYNHDTGNWEIVGPMTISSDGRFACSDPGFGIRAPGWHGVNPGTTGGGGPGLCGISCDEPPMPEGTELVDNKDTMGVLLFSGEFNHSVVDLHIKGIGLDFEWRRTYRSRCGTSTAQGNNWDYSYNISTRTDGRGVKVTNGGGREDLYRPREAEKFVFNGFFRELVQEAGSYTMYHEDGRKWIFQPDGGIAGGKIARLEDRFGNLIQFEYDGSGRLVRVLDTLKRPIDISYNSLGYIKSVRDFSGREVTYEYYTNASTNGAVGDLKSVTTPLILGTPNGNDFAFGKTTTYTYSSAGTDDHLAHNLTSITEDRVESVASAGPGALPRAPYLINEYSSETNPTNHLYDRVVRQIIGGRQPGSTIAPGPTATDTNIIDLVYIPFSKTNDVNSVIVNDRMGNVREYDCDCGSRMVEVREYTGRAVANHPTTRQLNRPTGRLRRTDPEVYVTKATYNDDSQPTRVIHPNGNATLYEYESALTPTVGHRLRGNLRKVTRLTSIPNPFSSTNVESKSIVERYEYLSGYGNRGIYNQPRFIIRYTDGRTNETVSAYNTRGQLIRRTHPIPGAVEEFEYDELGRRILEIHPANGEGYRRRDAFTWNGANLVAETQDQNGLALTNRMEYNAVGVLVRKIDPLGRDTLYVVNALDQVVREVSRQVNTDPPLRYQKDFYYDQFNDLTNVTVLNYVGQTLIATNPALTTVSTYDLLHNLVRLEQEIEPGRSAVTEYVYDANRNLAITRYGEATAGRQPGNVTQRLYDERNLLFREISAPGDPDQSTTQSDYDGNRNLVAIHHGLEANPHITVHQFDGFNRLVLSRDAMGNESRTTFDENANPVEVSTFGELKDIPGTSGNTLLSRAITTFDALNRVIEVRNAYFTNNVIVPAGGPSITPIGNGVSITRTEYAPNSLVIRTVDDNNHERLVSHDTMNRVRTVTDAKQNSITYDYDQNGNEIAITAVDKSDLGRPSEKFLTRKEYDPLDRLIKVIDSSGNVTTQVYDSRNNVVLTTDNNGNTNVFIHDGLNRLMETRKVLSDTGRGGGTKIGEIVTRQLWDDSSRMTAQIDDNGRATTYTYDALNRRISTRYADGTTQSTKYNVFGNIIRTEDANQTVVVSEFDAMDRVIEKTIAPGPGVANSTTFERYAYDGLSRMVAARDDDSNVERTYDSLSHLVGEIQTVFSRTNGLLLRLDSGSVNHEYDGVGNPLRSSYPGGRMINRTYDALNRRVAITDGELTIAQYSYIGPSRVEQRVYGNQTYTDFAYDGIQGRPNPPGDFGVARIIQTTHTRTNINLQTQPPTVMETILAAQEYTWDPQGNKTRRSLSVPAIREYSYLYDSADRLVQSLYVGGAPQVSTNGYRLDGLGNRLQTTNNGAIGRYQLSAASPAPQDAQVNQYTSTPFGERSYDQNGNLVGQTKIAAEVRTALYDYRNQLVALAETGTGMAVRYAYDALGRRIQRETSVETNRYFYHGFQTCEEQDSLGATLSTWVHGNGIDELLSYRRGAIDYFLHADDLQNIQAVTDGSGSVVERYEYEDYGAPRILDSNGDLRAVSKIRNPYLFQSHRYDTDTGFYYCRNRYLDPKAGRFIQRDPTGYADGMNLYGFLGNNPWSRIDPFGLESDDSQQEVADLQKPEAAAGDGGTLVDSVSAAAEGFYQDLFPPPKRYSEDTFEFRPIEGLKQAASDAPNLLLNSPVGGLVAKTVVKAGQKMVGPMLGPLLRGAQPRLFASERGAVRISGSGGAKKPPTAPASAFERTEARALQRPEKIAEYTASMKANGWQGEAISVFEHNGSKYILDGHHRVASARAAGVDVPYNSIPASRLPEYNYKSVDEVIWSAAEAGGR